MPCLLTTKQAYFATYEAYCSGPLGTTTSALVNNHVPSSASSFRIFTLVGDVNDHQGESLFMKRKCSVTFLFSHFFHLLLLSSPSFFSFYAEISSFSFPSLSSSSSSSYYFKYIHIVLQVLVLFLLCLIKAIFGLLPLFFIRLLVKRKDKSLKKFIGK